MDENTRLIPLTQGRFAKVDMADYSILAKYLWLFDPDGYARRARRKEEKFPGCSKAGVFMHRWLMGEPKEMVVDHINGDRLDNRRINLRVVPAAINNAFTKKPKGLRLAYFPNHKRKRRRQWQVGLNLPESGEEGHYIWLSPSLKTIVDEEDYSKLSAYNWYPLNSSSGNTYATRGKTGRGTVYMHKEILPSPPGMVTDHKNGDSLDNRRENLRIAPLRGNAANSRRDLSQHGYRGVYMKGDKYYCYVSENNKMRHIPGGHYTPEQAARSRDREAVKVYGEFAVLNFPERKEGISQILR